MQNYLRCRNVFLRLFIFFLFTSSRLFAADDGVICEPVSDLTSGFPEKAFLTDSRQACFKPVGDNRTVFSLFSASSLSYFLSTVFSAALKAVSADAVFSGRPGGVWSHKNQWLAESPSQASILKTLLKNRLIPDGSFSGEANDRKKNRLEEELELAVANWQKLVKRPSYPAAVVSVSDAAMRVVITRGDGLRNTNLNSLYEKLINIQTQSYLALLDTESLKDIAGVVTGGLVASGSGGDGDDDDNDSTHYTFDVEPEPLVIVYDGREYPEQGSAEELTRKNLKNKRRLLKILRKKMQQAIALGHGDLARILDNRIMLITADLEHLTDLDTSSTGITENDQGSPGILSFLKVSLATDDRELLQRDDDALKQALSQYLVNTDYQSVLIVFSELTHEEALFYERWQNTATGLVYQALRRRLEQQLRSKTDDINVSTKQTESLVSGLEALVHQFRKVFSADFSSRYDGRQAPNEGEKNHSQPKTSSHQGAGGKSSKSDTRTNKTHQGNKNNSGRKDDEGDGAPDKVTHTYSKTIACPLCGGPCKEEKSEDCILEVEKLPRRTTAPEHDRILPPTLSMDWRLHSESPSDLEKIKDNMDLEYRVYTSNDQVQKKLETGQMAAVQQQEKMAKHFDELLEKEGLGQKISSRRDKNLLDFKTRLDRRITEKIAGDINVQKTKGNISLTGHRYYDSDEDIFKELAPSFYFHTETETGSGVAHCIGRRESMDDAVLCARFIVQTQTGEVEIKLTGVFDGHGEGGDIASGFVRDNIVQHLKKRLEADNPESLDDLRIMNALKLAFVDTGNSFTPPKGKTECGTTANVVLQIDGNLWTANAGDSRALLLDPEGKVIQLSEDAKPSDGHYKKSIEKRGGYVSKSGRVNHILNVARGIGDHDLSGAISARPKITRQKLPPGGWEGYRLVQACDGLFEVTNSDVAGEFVHSSVTRRFASNAVIAGELVELAYEAGSGDNLSVIVTSLSSPGKAPAASQGFGK